MSLFAGGPDKAKKRKVVFVGDYWVGKRALRTKLSHGIVSCNPGAEYRQSTVVEVTISKKGPSLSQWRAVSLRKDSEILQLHLWVLAPEDTNGYCFTEAVLYGAHVVVLCCNMTNSESLESVIHKVRPYCIYKAWLHKSLVVSQDSSISPSCSCPLGQLMGPEYQIRWLTEFDFRRDRTSWSTYRRNMCTRMLSIWQGVCRQSTTCSRLGSIPCRD